MSDHDVNLEESVNMLARRFDEGFTQPVRLARTGLLPMLIVTLGGGPHAIPLSNLCHFALSSVIIRLPRQNPACLGLTAFRGKPIAVFSLARLLGFVEYDTTPRWLAVTHGHVAVAIHALKGQVYAHPDDLRQAGTTTTARIVMVDSEPCPLIDLDSLISSHLMPASSGENISKE